MARSDASVDRVALWDRHRYGRRFQPLPGHREHAARCAGTGYERKHARVTDASVKSQGPPPKPPPALLPVAAIGVQLATACAGETRTLTTGFMVTYLSLPGFTLVLVYGPTRSVARCTHTSSTPIGSLPAASLARFILGGGLDSAGALMTTVPVALETFFNGEGAFVGAALGWLVSEIQGFRKMRLNEMCDSLCV